MAQEQGIARAVRRPWLPLLLTLLLCVPALYPLLLPGFVEGNDGVEHVFRVLALATAWRQSDIAGNLLPRWIPNLALGFGYPLFGVYSPLAYVVPAALTLLGVAPILAVKCAVGLALLAAGLGGYLSLRPFTGPVAAIAGGVTYVYAPYTLANAYVRLDLAELSAMACAALALAMLLRLAGGEVAPAALWRRVVPAAVALAAVPLCHNLSALTFLPLVAAVWLVLLGQAVLASRADANSKACVRASALRGTFPLFAVPLLALALAAFFLLPAWRWQASTHLALIPDDPAFYAKLLHPLALAQRHFGVPGWGWFAAGSAWWNFSVAPSPQGEFGAGPSSLAWLTVPAALLASCRLSGRRRALVLGLVVVGVLSVLLMTSLALPLWQAAAHLTLLQFPWRFAGPLCLVTALLIGMLLTLAPLQWRIIPAAACIALALLPALVYLRPDPIAIPAGSVTWPAQMRRELIGGYGTTGSGLFLPRWVPGHSPAVPVLPPPPAGATDLHFTALTGRADAFTARYQAAQPVSLTLGEWYFPGWRVQVDGHALASAPGAGGLLHVVVPAGSHQLTIARGITTSELAGGLITLAGVLASVVLLLGPGRPAFILGTVAALVGIGLLGIFPPLSFSALVGRGPVWSVPATVAPGQAIQPAAWRVVQLPVWGATPVLEVAWLGERAPVGDDRATLQVTAPDGHVLATVTRGPRMGTISTTNWPAGMLLFDHLPIPLPPRSGGVCDGTYHLTLAIGGGGAPATRLGGVTLPCAPVTVPSVAQVTTSTIKGLSAGPLPVIQPGSALSLDLTLRVPGPTATDEVLAFQLLDHTGRPVAQVQSYGNVDLRFSTLWRAGQSVPYSLRLALPGALAPGVYRLSLQRFSPASGKVAPLAGEMGQTGQNLILATVKVAAPHVVPMAEPVARFGSSIGLLVPTAAVPVLHGQAGASVSVPLRWLALVPPTADYTVFVHLLDATGKLVTQADGPPLAGSYPTSAWGAGEVIDDPRTLQLPANLPPGRYAVHVGWYLPATGARLTVTPAVKDNAVVVADVVVGATAAHEAVRVP